MSLLTGDELLNMLKTAGAEEVTVDGGGSIWGIFTEENITPALVGSAVTTSNPTLFVRTVDAPERQTSLTVNSTSYSVYDVLKLDDGAISLLELHKS